MRATLAPAKTRDGAPRENSGMPSQETRALYESMPTDQLRELRAAFELDMKNAKPETIAFGTGRLALIAEVLARRAGQ
jgi:hypothetical protein